MSKTSFTLHVWSNKKYRLSERTINVKLSYWRSHGQPNDIFSDMCYIYRLAKIYDSSFTHILRFDTEAELNLIHTLN